MIREGALKAVLVVVGLLFVATAYPLVAMGLDETLQMMLSLYVTLGVFLLLAASNPRKTGPARSQMCPCVGGPQLSVLRQVARLGP